MSAKRRSWLIGLAIATVGVVLARVVSPQYDQDDQVAVRLVIYAVGTLLALAGLGVIMFGIRKSSMKG